jgi:excisionase family DNA binding protein
MTSNINSKALLTIEEVCLYTGLSKSYLYKITSKNLISYHKPLGKKIFIDRLVLEEFLRRNRIKSIEEIECEVSTNLNLDRR